MDRSLSQRAQSIKASPTLAITAKAAALRAQGKNIIGLDAGQPDFDTPEHIKEAAKKAINDGLTKYTAADGMPELKQAIIAKFQRENNLEYQPGQIAVSCGAKHSLFNLFQAYLNPGDEIIIPAPYWVSYPDMAKLAGAEARIIPTGIPEKFKINPGQLRSAIGAKTRMMIINSPANPTGGYYSKNELAALAEVLCEFPQILVVTDDIYEHILWGADRFNNIVNVCPELYERTVVVNGVSKAYSMTGWRIGYAGGPEWLLKGIKNIQSQSTSNATSIAQAAAVEALSGDQSCIRESAGLFRQRHDYVLGRLQNMPGIHCLPAEGTFYIFPDMSNLINESKNIDNDIDLAAFFLDKAEVSTIPGSAFGAPGHIRISFATSMKNLEESMDRISKNLEAAAG